MPRMFIAIHRSWRRCCHRNRLESVSVHSHLIIPRNHFCRRSITTGGLGTSILLSVSIFIGLYAVLVNFPLILSLATNRRARQAQHEFKTTRRRNSTLTATRTFRRGSQYQEIQVNIEWASVVIINHVPFYCRWPLCPTCRKISSTRVRRGRKSGKSRRCRCRWRRNVNLKINCRLVHSWPLEIAALLMVVPTYKRHAIEIRSAPRGISVLLSFRAMMKSSFVHGDIK